MNKKKLVVLTLLVALMFTLASCMLVACNPDDNTTDDSKTLTATEGLLISNGDFKVTGTASDSYPRTITGWSGAKMYNSGSYRDDVIAGAVKVSKDVYNANKAKWDDNSDALYNALTAAGGRYGEGDDIKNALMIYMPEQATDKSAHGPTAYGYTSTSFTLDKGAYYVLTVDVLTHNIKGNKDGLGGARIYVSSNTYAEFDNINTNDTWKTYEIYIETSPTASTSLSVMLGLGKANSSMTSDGLTTGYAFFDNVSLKKLTTDEVKGDDALSKVHADDPTATFAQKVAAEKQDNSTIATATLKVPNGRFDFGSLSPSYSGAPNSWSVVTGNSNQTDAADTTIGRNAIVDLDLFKAIKDLEIDARRQAFKDDSILKNFNRTYTLANEAGSITYDTIADLTYTDFLEKLLDATRGGAGSNIFVLSQSTMTAQGIRSSRNITIEKGTSYALSIWVYGYKIHGEGVTLKLTGSDGKDIIIKGIAKKKDESNQLFIGNRKVGENGNFEGEAADTEYGYTDGWTQYTFYIKGNQYKDYSYNMELWLGTEGKSSNTEISYKLSGSDSRSYTAGGTFANGWAFFDDLQLDVVDEAAWAATIDGAYNTDNTLDVSTNNNKAIAVDLTTDNAVLGGFLNGNETIEKLEGNDLQIPAGWTSTYDFDSQEYADVLNIIKAGRVNLSDENATFNSKVELPYEFSVKDAFAIHATADTYFDVETKPISIKANNFYRISFWLKTVDVKSTSGAYVTLLNKTAQAENAAKDGKDIKDEDEVQLTSFTRVNTDGVDEYLNDWVEINIVIRGAQDKDTEVALKFALGTGNRWATSTLTTGTVYFANFNMATLTYSNFNSTSTGTYTKSVNLTDSYDYSKRVSNGNFDEFDADDDNLDFENHELLSQQEYAAKPLNWTISDSSVEVNKTENNDKADIFAGILQLEKDDPDTDDGKYNASQQATAVTSKDTTFFNNFFGADSGAFNKEDIEKLSGPNMLAIGSDEGAAIGFASDSFTLSANSFYVLSVYARGSHATASIFLTGEASVDSDSKFVVTSAADDTAWTKFTFYIEVGKTSVSIRLNLWLGQDQQYTDNVNDLPADEFAANLRSTGMVFFDNVLFESIDEAEFEKQTKSLDGATQKKISFLTDSFDSLSSTTESRSTLATPTGWSGAAGTNQTSSNSKAGILYADKGFFGEKNIDDNYRDYAEIFGKDYSTSDSSITVTENEQNAIKAEALKEGTEEYTLYNSFYNSETRTWDDAGLIEAIREQKVLALKQSRWIPSDKLHNRTHSGNQMLVINNTSDSAYTYTSSSNTLKANTVYQVSVWVRTYGIFTDKVTDDDIKAAKADPEYAKYKIGDGRWDLAALKQAIQQKKYADQKAGAYIELYLGSANDIDEPFRFPAIISDDGWTEYKFYVETNEDDVTSVTIKLSLGSYNDKTVDGETVVTGLTSGYAMFDDIMLTPTEYDSVDDITIGEGDHALTRKIALDTAGNPNTPEENEGGDTTNANNFNLEALWWMIPTIVLGVMIIAVVIVFIVRKVRKKDKGDAAPKKVNAATPAQTLDDKHDRYDDDKE